MVERQSCIWKQQQYLNHRCEYVRTCCWNLQRHHHSQCDGIFFENGRRHTDGQCSNDLVRHVDMDPNTDSDLAGYKIYRATASGAYGAALGTVPAGTVTYQATGLSANTTYFFVITAYDNAGNESLFSNEVSRLIY